MKIFPCAEQTVVSIYLTTTKIFRKVVKSKMLHESLIYSSSIFHRPNQPFDSSLSYILSNEPRFLQKYRDRLRRSIRSTVLSSLSSTSLKVYSKNSPQLTRRNARRLQLRLLISWSGIPVSEDPVVELTQRSLDFFNKIEEIIWSFRNNSVWVSLFYMHQANK